MLHNHCAEKHKSIIMGISNSFLMDEKFFLQKEDMAMGSSLSPVVYSIFMEYSEENALSIGIP